MTDLKSAQRRYNARQNEIAELIAQLEAELKIHEQQARSEGVNHAHTGDLGHVASQLEELVAFMQGQD